MYQPLQRTFRAATIWSGPKALGRTHQRCPRAVGNRNLGRLFHRTSFLAAVKPYLLADIGEGITECQITAWFVKPGDKVQQFDQICEVQSDKASVEITSRFDGTILKLHHNVDEMVKVGNPLLDIEVNDADAKDETTLSSETGDFLQPDIPPEKANPIEEVMRQEGNANTEVPTPGPSMKLGGNTRRPKNSGLVTPAVRHMLKELNLDISDIQATGKGRRVLKEDVQRHIEAISNASAPNSVAPSKPVTEDRVVPLNRVQSQMVQSMTKSLQIPHFLYTNIVNMTNLSSLRRQFANTSSAVAGFEGEHAPIENLSVLPFILKALSRAATEFPIINSSLDTISQPGKPQLLLKSAHNIGIAIDTPNGLVVPVIRNVQDHSIMSLALEIKRLRKSALDGTLNPNEMSGATLVVSNIGSIGGHIVSPIILDPNVLILGVGKSRNVPVFETDDQGNDKIIKQEQLVLSWSADHRVLDGATMARCAERVTHWLENFAMIGLYCR